MVKRVTKFSLVLALMSGVSSTRAETFVDVKSSTDGSGHFQYETTIVYDGGLVTGLYQVAIDAGPFTNLVMVDASSPGWTCSYTNSWLLDLSLNYQLPFYSHTLFGATSSENSHKRGDLYVMYGLSYRSCLASGYEGVISAVGYDHAFVPIPCPPTEADGFPASYEHHDVWLPDVQVSEIGFKTVTTVFSNYSITAGIQASANLAAWSNIAYFIHYPPSTTWTSKVPLSTYGNFFRATYVSGCLITSLVTQSVTPLSRIPTSSPVNLHPAMATPGGFLVNAETVAGETYYASLRNQQGGIIQLVGNFVATGSVTTVEFPFSKQVDTALFDVRQTYP